MLVDRSASEAVKEQDDVIEDDFSQRSILDSFPLRKMHLYIQVCLLLYLLSRSLIFHIFPSGLQEAHHMILMPFQLFNPTTPYFWFWQNKSNTFIVSVLDLGICDRHFFHFLMYHKPNNKWMNLENNQQINKVTK